MDLRAESATEQIVLNESLRPLRNNGWIADGTKNCRTGDLSFVLGAPDSLRLLTADRLATMLSLFRNEGSSWLKTGFSIRPGDSDARARVHYTGPDDLPMFETLIAAMKIQEFEVPPDWSE